MNASLIRFRCPSCKARIKAPAQLLGRQRPCPGCGENFIVRTDAPEDSGPHLVFRENGDHVSIDAMPY